MTTTAARPRLAALRRGGDLMDVSFKIAPRRRGEAPHAEDTHRVGAMRRIIAARLRYWGLEAMAGDAMLIVSELLTNAILHSGTTEISLTVAVKDGLLRITVGDGMAGYAQPQLADGNGESGRGLFLVEALARENGGVWGTSEAGATTWCHLAVPAGEQL